MVLNSKGQVTIPAHLRAKHNLHEGDEVEAVEVGGALRIVRAEGAGTRGQRLASAARRAGGRAGAGGGILRCMASNPSARPGSAAGAGSAAALGRGATLITVAPTGAEAGKAAVPALPASLGELVTTAKECQAAGAAVIHVHIRDAEARPTLDPVRLRETVAALRESTSLVVQLSTGGAVTDTFGDRLAVLDAAPDACSLTCGTVNFGDEVFANPWPFIRELYARTRELGVVPEFELFDLGHVATLHRLLDEEGTPAGGRVHCDLVMGVPGGMPGDAATLVAAVSALPPGATWSATGIGRTSLPVMFGALAAGGHLRVGMEDTLSYARGRPVTGNAELVERAAELARLAQRPPMSAADARTFLGISQR